MALLMEQKSTGEFRGLEIIARHLKMSPESIEKVSKKIKVDDKKLRLRIALHLFCYFLARKRSKSQKIEHQSSKKSIQMPKIIWRRYAGEIVSFVQRSETSVEKY